MASPLGPLRVLAGEAELDRATIAAPPSASGGLAFVLPTYVGRSSLEANLASLEALAAQLEDISGVAPDRQLLLIVGMQWDRGQQQEAMARLEALREVANAAGRDFIGLSLPRSRKNATLNEAFRIGGERGIVGIGWIDDDVRLAPQCIARLVQRFLAKGARGAVGAHKIPSPRVHRASRILLLAKQISKTPHLAYPHGCCMIVDATVAQAGIPARYLCEDDYICFSLLQPRARNPLDDLEIVHDAICFHTVGGPAREIYRRIRRSLLTGHVLQADFPPEISSFYVRQMQFRGLWPIGRFDRGLGVRGAAKKWIVKAVYFLWFVQVGLELILRGALRRPLREIQWSPYSEYEVPNVAAPREHVGDVARSGAMR